MIDYFDKIVAWKYPDGATVAQLQKLDRELQDFEDEVFAALPWLINPWVENGKLNKVSEEKADELILYLYTRLHHGKKP